ncbi:MAG: hypothetical protein K6G30_10490, partial [Acetatifactor sp.]|nr:hypothetical protein [Acetatifactor sp.]
MPELSPQICSYIPADKSCYAHGTDKVYEMPEVWKKKLAEKSSYKRRVSRPWKGHPGGCLFSVLATVRFSEVAAWNYP